MGLGDEAPGRELLHLTRAGRHIEGPTTSVAEEVVMVREGRRLVPRHLTWEGDLRQPPFLHQPSQVPVHRGLPERRNPGPGELQDLLGSEGSSDFIEDPSNRFPLLRASSWHP